MELLIQGLYPEELLSEKTDELINKTPVMASPRQGGSGSFGKLAALALVSMAAAGTYLYFNKRAK